MAISHFIKSTSNDITDVFPNRKIWHRSENLERTSILRIPLNQTLIWDNDISGCWFEEWTLSPDGDPSLSYIINIFKIVIWLANIHNLYWYGQICAWYSPQTNMSRHTGSSYQNCDHAWFFNNAQYSKKKL